MFPFEAVESSNGHATFCNSIFHEVFGRRGKGGLVYVSPCGEHVAELLFGMMLLLMTMEVKGVPM